MALSQYNNSQQWDKLANLDREKHYYNLLHDDQEPGNGEHDVPSRNLPAGDHPAGDHNPVEDEGNTVDNTSLQTTSEERLAPRAAETRTQSLAVGYGLDDVDIAAGMPRLRLHGLQTPAHPEGRSLAVNNGLGNTQQGHPQQTGTQQGGTGTPQPERTPEYSSHAIRNPAPGHVELGHSTPGLSRRPADYAFGVTQEDEMGFDQVINDPMGGNQIEGDQMGAEWQRARGFLSRTGLDDRLYPDRCFRRRRLEPQPRERVVFDRTHTLLDTPRRRGRPTSAPEHSDRDLPPRLELARLGSPGRELPMREEGPEAPRNRLLQPNQKRRRVPTSEPAWISPTDGVADWGTRHMLCLVQHPKTWEQPESGAAINSEGGNSEGGNSDGGKSEGGKSEGGNSEGGNSEGHVPIKSASGRGMLDTPIWDRPQGRRQSWEDSSSEEADRSWESETVLVHPRLVGGMVQHKDERWPLGIVYDQWARITNARPENPKEYSRFCLLGFGTEPDYGLKSSRRNFDSWIQGRKERGYCDWDWLMRSTCASALNRRQEGILEGYPLCGGVVEGLGEQGTLLKDEQRTARDEVTRSRLHNESYKVGPREVGEQAFASRNPRLLPWRVQRDALPPVPRCTRELQAEMEPFATDLDTPIPQPPIPEQEDPRGRWSWYDTMLFIRNLNIVKVPNGQWKLISWLMFDRKTNRQCRDKFVNLIKRSLLAKNESGQFVLLKDPDPSVAIKSYSPSGGNTLYNRTRRRQSSRPSSESPQNTNQEID
ncbi:hypothetical protein GNI_003580 [Gregarina niphandrodes]|uniref:Myb-like domain-containing protein n=1 Tax=Gregarina niphandrodes TaxID=110365 RepID=A0A023BDN2_GRENI|nr:hypothetical protein GNI_003580 [Gregarina niphandrodes]EZG89018.1 hypothetical protein GNI_003580 [Gregarina niphandrodes]|eukprot:XP_011128525.1 hypothetical protein GNI_003580 [Gregarina niphandrodes]